jgi:hypothetical protein
MRVKMGELVALPIVEAENARAYRELDQRTIGNLVCTLWWNETYNTVSVEIVEDEVTDTFPVPNDKAWDAFQHPYFYRPSDGA